MRRSLILFAVAACFVAGCGSSSTSSSNPLSTELSYLPTGTPLVLTVATDPNGAAIKGVNALVGRFPLASIGIGALKSKLQQSGVNYDGDIRPLLGNPVAFAITAPQISTHLSTNALVVWVTKDGDKLKSLVKKVGGGLHQTGTHDGATIYSSRGSGVVALDGATALFGSSVGIVNAALDRHAHGGGITSARYARAFAGLPQDAVIKSFGDLSSLLSSPSAAKARRIPWVAALRSYAETVTASASGLTFNYHLDTTGAPLTPSQLPFAPGTTPPAFAGSVPITVGIHDPAQIVSFFEAAEQTTNPAGWARALAGQAKLRAKTGADINSLVKLMTGDLIIGSDASITVARVTVSDPAATRQVLDKFAGSHVTVFGGAPLTKLGSDYALRSGRTQLLLTVIGNQFVVGGDSIAHPGGFGALSGPVRSFATAPTSPAPGAHGAVAFRVSLNQLLALVLRQTPPQAVQSILSQLTDITGSNSVSPSGLTGSATIGVK
jgi:Protein of unknown function (DUF3352)